MGIAGMLGLSIIFTITFFIAYYAPGQALTITVNEYGEAGIEFVLFAVLVPINIGTAVYALVMFKRLETGTGHTNYSIGYNMPKKEDNCFKAHLHN